MYPDDLSRNLVNAAKSLPGYWSVELIWYTVELMRQLYAWTFGFFNRLRYKNRFTFLEIDTGLNRIVNSGDFRRKLKKNS